MTTFVFLTVIAIILIKIYVYPVKPITADQIRILLDLGIPSDYSIDWSYSRANRMIRYLSSLRGDDYRITFGLYRGCRLGDVKINFQRWVNETLPPGPQKDFLLKQCQTTTTN